MQKLIKLLSRCHHEAEWIFKFFRGVYRQHHDTKNLSEFSKFWVSVWVKHHDFYKHHDFVVEFGLNTKIPGHLFRQRMVLHGKYDIIYDKQIPIFNKTKKFCLPKIFRLDSKIGVSCQKLTGCRTDRVLLTPQTLGLPAPDLSSLSLTLQAFWFPLFWGVVQEPVYRPQFWPTDYSLQSRFLVSRQVWASWARPFLRPFSSSGPRPWSPMPTSGKGCLTWCHCTVCVRTQTSIMASVECQGIKKKKNSTWVDWFIKTEKESSWMLIWDLLDQKPSALNRGDADGKNYE